MSEPYYPADVMDRAQWFVHDRFGLFIHWGVYAVPAQGEWAYLMECIPEAQYRRYAERFNPTAFDAQAWVDLAQEAGMQYLVFTTKHHDGFCMFDNPANTGWKITDLPFGRDVTKELADACHRSGMKLGLYHSLIDWMHPDYKIVSLHPGANNEAVNAQPREHQRYIDYLHQSVRHLLTHYGEVKVLWLDFTPADQSPEDWDAAGLMRIVRDLQPQVLVDDRLDNHMYGHENRFPGDFASPEIIVPYQPVTFNGQKRVWETCMTMNEHWGYVASDQQYKPTRALIHMLAHCVANDGNLLLNVGPDAKGRIPEAAVTRLREIGSWMRENGESIYGCGPAPGFTPPPGCVYTQKGNRLFLHVLTWPYMALRLPGMKGRLRSAWLLRDGSCLMENGWFANQDDVTLTLPFHAPDPHDTVIEIDLAD